MKLSIEQSKKAFGSIIWSFELADILQYLRFSQNEKALSQIWVTFGGIWMFLIFVYEKAFFEIIPSSDSFCITICLSLSQYAKEPSSITVKWFGILIFSIDDDDEKAFLIIWRFDSFEYYEVFCIHEMNTNQ